MISLVSVRTVVLADAGSPCACPQTRNKAAALAAATAAEVIRPPPQTVFLFIPIAASTCVRVFVSIHTPRRGHTLYNFKITSCSAFTIAVAIVVRSAATRNAVSIGVCTHIMHSRASTCR